MRKGSFGEFKVLLCSFVYFTLEMMVFLLHGILKEKYSRKVMRWRGELLQKNRSPIRFESTSQIECSLNTVVTASDTFYRFRLATAFEVSHQFLFELFASSHSHERRRNVLLAIWLLAAISCSHTYSFWNAKGCNKFLTLPSKRSNER